MTGVSPVTMDDLTSGFNIATASESKLAANHAEALAQLEAYSKCVNLASLAAGTPVHFLDIEFRGRELIRGEEIRF